MAGGSMISTGPEWDQVVRRYAQASAQVQLVSKGVVAWAQAQGVTEAQHQLDTLVYNAPITASGYVRTGNTRRAVRKDPIQSNPGEGASGTIRVDSAIANREGFYYPRVLNAGRAGTRYYPRPFWSLTEALMKIRYKKQGEAALAELGQKLSIG